MHENGDWSSPVADPRGAGGRPDHTEAGLAEMLQIADDVVAALRG